MSVSVTAFEIDKSVLAQLRYTLDSCAESCVEAGIGFEAEVREEDFIASALATSRSDLFTAAKTPFNTVIMNPPYRKINSDSHTRWLLRSAGLETSNLYTGFLAMALALLCEDGDLVAITPRSFCNGPYFRPFRELFLERIALQRIHVFESRSAAFQADGVLQENVILHGKKSRATPREVIVSANDGPGAASLVERKCRYADVVAPNDPEMFIHLVTDDTQHSVRQRIRQFRCTLENLGLVVSTGRVVDFRAKEYLSPDPAPGTAPLIYPCHFKDGFVQWPLTPSRKPNAIIECEQTRVLLVPNDHYILVKRFSSKEERRRIVACIHDPRRVPAQFVGFENHLNYFHAKGKGLPFDLAKGLMLYLNSTLVDSYFRQFNGHTQVNATDLRNLPYPPPEALLELGLYLDKELPVQHDIDELMERVLFHVVG